MVGGENGMTRKEIAKDFFSKVVLPVFIAWFLYAMFKPVFTKEGVTDYFLVWLMCGIPFGIRRVYLWIIPRGFDIGGTVGVWAINFIVGGLIGGVVLIWRLVCAAWYLILTVYRIATYSRANIITTDIQFAPAKGEKE